MAKEKDSIEKALEQAKAKETKTKAKKPNTVDAYKKEDAKIKLTGRMGRGQPKKEEKEKATNTVVLYFNEAEIKDIKEVAEINGFNEKDKNKYLKSAIKKVLRAELRNFGR